ncbi:MAG: alpha-glycosidase, partial [Prevotella sp.]|nr:alpha-glycosidase [Prevotella sp.]
MPYINENDRMKIVDWMPGAVFYQIFVDRFCIGDENKDLSYVNMHWGDLPTPKSFAGGDLRGIIKRLDYLQELGINAIYL